MMRSLRLLAVLIAFSACALPVSAQPALPTIPRDGFEILCQLLHNASLQPITSLQAAALDPQDTIILVLGVPEVLPHLNRATGGLKKFLNDGGNLIIATDRATEDRGLGFRVTGDVIRVPEALLDTDAYGPDQKYPECPFLRFTEPDVQGLHFEKNRLVPFFQKGRDVRTHPLFMFLHQGIATNVPSEIEVTRQGTNLQNLLDYPFLFREDAHPLYMIGSPQKSQPLGRELYIAGHGMFMNGMMLKDDNDNRAFTSNAIRWLAERADGKTRSKALLIVDGEIMTNFDMKLTPPIPMPPLKAISRLIRGLEDERFFHRLLADVLGSRMGLVCGVLAALVTLGVLIYGAKKLGSARQRTETGVPNLLRPEPPMSVLASVEERQQAILRQGDYWEEALFLVLKWFRQEFDVTPNRWQSVNATFRASGFLWSRRRLQKEADRILRLAQVTSRSDVSRHDFFVVVETLRELSTAVKDGRLTLLVEGKSVQPATII